VVLPGVPTRAAERVATSYAQCSSRRSRSPEPSSLSYLRDLPITEIKLDRSFLQGIPHDTHNAAIVRSTVELAHALELPIVGEGVQDDAALAWLAEIGCDLGQGFHICTPLPLPDLLCWLESSGLRTSGSEQSGVGPLSAP